MAYQTIPTDQTLLLYDQITQLEGTEYLLTFWWSVREACWYMEMADQDGNPIASGIKLVSSVSLLRRFLDSRLPPGLLMLVDMTGAQEEITQSSDLGNRFLLTYVTSDDPTLAGVDLKLL